TDDRRRLAVVHRRRDRLTAGRQVRRHGGAVGRSANGAAGADRRSGGACDISGGPRGLPAVTPALADLLDRLHVVALPMRVRFRGITTRELALLEGPAGWGEFGPFLEYGPREAAHWLASGIEGAYRRPPPVRRDRIPINAT